MLNFEHNHTVFKLNDETGELYLSSDVRPFPIINTIHGKSLHYKATCGIIYYNKKNGEADETCENGETYSTKIINLVMGIYNIISKHEDHLLKERVTAVTGSCIVKQNIFTNGTFMLKAKKPYMVSKKNIEQFPARALIILPKNYQINYSNYPPHYSTRASFTWYFMPVQYDLSIDSISSINALISSIYLDIENNIKYNHNDITNYIKYSDCISINIINTKINDKFIIFDNLPQNESIWPVECSLLCIGTKNRIPSYKMNKKFIKTYNDVECVNSEKKCDSCDEDVSNFSVGFPLEYNNIIPIVSLLCHSCWSSSNKYDFKKSCFIFSTNLINVIKMYPKIYKITQKNFIEALSEQYIDLVKNDLQKFSPTCDILITNSSIYYVTSNIANYEKYLIIQLHFDIV